MHPAALSAGVRERASIIRDTVQTRIIGDTIPF
jgi:hypothetical protein